MRDSAAGTHASLLLLSDGRIVSGSRDRSLRIWNPSSGECETVLQGLTTSVTSLLLLSDGRIVSDSRDRSLRIWNPSSGECETVLQGLTTSVTSLLLLSDGRIASGSGDKTLRIWNPSSGKCETVLQAWSPPCYFSQMAAFFQVSGVFFGLLRSLGQVRSGVMRCVLGRRLVL